MSNDIQITNLNKDQILKVIVEDRQPNDNLDTQQYELPYRMVGDGRMQKGTHQGYPFIKILMTLTVPEQWFFELVYDHLNYLTNIAIIPSKNLSKTELNKLSIAYKNLNQKNLVKRVSPHRYMVNPDAIIYINRYSQNKKLWDQL